jgi:hypothetical protein
MRPLSLKRAAEIMSAMGLKELKPRLREAHQRHRDRFGGAVTELAQALSREHAFQVDLLLSGPRSLIPRGSMMDDSFLALHRYLVQMQWVIWGDCELGPPIALQCQPDEVALGVLAYLSARLMDDAIDGHRTYKGQLLTFYGKLSESRSECEAAEAASLAGGFLLNEALCQLSKRGYRSSARILRNLYSEVFSGALAEALISGSKCTARAYQAIVAHKAVAYDRMLHEVFFSTCPQPLRTRILYLLTRHSEISQWLNDYCDETDDRERGQLSILRIQGMDRKRVAGKIVASFNWQYEACQTLPAALSDAFSLRLLDSVLKFEEQGPHDN